jgi:hypothetical protein
MSSAPSLCVRCRGARPYEALGTRSAAQRTLAVEHDDPRLRAEFGRSSRGRPGAARREALFVVNNELGFPGSVFDELA